MPNAYMGQLLRINLTTKEWDTEPITDEQVRNYLLGSGLAAKIFYEEMDPALDALDPASPLMFVTGLLTGTPAPTSSRSAVCGRSPLTGIWNEANFGGYWGAELKFAGCDGIVLTGRAAEPTYLWVHDDTVEFRPAGELWGLDTYATDERIKAATDPKAQVSCIGPAGERGVPLANVVFGGIETRCAGRGGMGAVMGSKNLKAIAVRGTKRPQYADRQALTAAVRETNPWIKDNSIALSKMGTASGVRATENTGDLSVKNWQMGTWKEGSDQISGEAIAETILTGHYRCFGCPIGCGKDVEVTDGPYAGVKGHGPEYETLAGFGALVLNDDLNALSKMNDLCNRYGLDTISTSTAIAFGIEAYERGLLTDEDTDGLELAWGDAPSIIELIERINRREGVGALLGDGVRAAAEKLGGGADHFAIHAKGLEIAYHDPRAFVSMAANYATANRGGCHLEALSYWNGYGITLPDLGYPEALDRFDSTVGGKLAVDYQNYTTVYNGLGLCKLLIKGKVGPSTIVRYVNAAMGWEWTADDLLRMGEKLFNLKRMINVRYGITRADDTLPPRLLTEPRPAGSAEGVLPDLDRMLADYYEIRGWNPDGSPGEERLAELGLA